MKKIIYFLILIALALLIVIAYDLVGVNSQKSSTD
ncbi:MAG: hypothetical protein PWR08_2003, partial [Thermoanaerobacterium sp.]|nr:hypothetical protein [Thermoanaerobacterium sp.]